MDIPSVYPSEFTAEDKNNFLQTTWLKFAGQSAQMIKEASEALFKQQNTVRGVAATLKVPNQYISLNYRNEDFSLNQAFDNKEALIRVKTTEIKELKSEIKKLMIEFREENRRTEKALRSGINKSAIYQPSDKKSLNVLPSNKAIEYQFRHWIFIKRRPAKFRN